ncbi:hypothetical protein S40293_00609 [Stachybotrys chartarum IBT 40293]|nr:hypothetical protein S40293_00609 [Stachybotrys chartarum IBT 40293]
MKQLSVEVLDGPHRDLLEHAVSRVLHTDIAEVTYAQIVDGIPLSEVARDARRRPPPQHPIHHAHKELCPGVRERTQEFRDGFSLKSIRFDSQALLAYLAAAPGSRSFNTRLIELLAIAVHQIAVYLFRLDLGLHKDDGIIEWAPPKSDDWYWQCHPDGPLHTLFLHTWYQDHEQYPNGIADVVGYWAEARIFGGVVLFDRRKPKDGLDSDAVYLHPNGGDLTYRICRLLPEQKQALVEFISSPKSCPDPLPILPDERNRERVDPEEPLEETGIFRNIWERKHRPVTHSDPRLKDVCDPVDYPTLVDKRDAQRRAKDWIRLIEQAEDERLARVMDLDEEESEVSS